MLGLDNPVHILILLVVVLLLFGAKRLPEMGRSLGGGLRGFKESLTGDDPPAANAEQLNAAPAPVATTVPAVETVEQPPPDRAQQVS